MKAKYNLKILHINTSDKGGAAKACERLHLALKSNVIDSKLLSLYNFRSNSTAFNSFLPGNPSVINRSLRSIRYRWYELEKELLLLKRPRDYEIISFPKTAFDITKHPLYKEADVIHFHWVSRFLDYRSFFKKNSKPVVWTLHDLNPFSGLFHYENDLLKNYHNYQRLDEKVRLKKFNSLVEANNLTFVAVSDWLRNKFLSSEIANSFSCVKISNGVDLKKYMPQDKSYLRQKFGLPLDKKIILFVAENTENERKGFKYLLEALHNVNKSNVLLCVLGESKRMDSLNGFRVHHFGFLEDEILLSQIYGLADLFVISSLEDNYPNTIVEAISCGVPVVGFEAGGIPEMIVQNQTGLLADLSDVRQLSRNINILLEDENLLENYSLACRKFAEDKFSVDTMAEKYNYLYRKVSS